MLARRKQQLAIKGDENGAAASEALPAGSVGTVAEGGPKKSAAGSNLGDSPQRKRRRDRSKERGAAGERDRSHKSKDRKREKKRKHSKSKRRKRDRSKEDSAAGGGAAASRNQNALDALASTA